MTNLNLLTVSLTKHGAHKVARLIDHFPVEEVLSNVNNDDIGIHIDPALARKILSVYGSTTVPQIWDFAKQHSAETVNALTLVSIIFSHWELIKLFQSATNTDHSGIIQREWVSNVKGFTNLSNNFLELGYSTENKKRYFSYDFKSLFNIYGLGSLVNELLRLKLQEARWDRRGLLIDEIIRLEFNKVFGLDPERMKEWLQSGTLAEQAKALHEIYDLDFLTRDNLQASSQPFEFVPGHSPRQVGTTIGSSRDSAYTITLLHNEIQNSLYNKLSEEYGRACVGTEQPTGNGTLIDIVVKTDDFCYFYEIKTASTAKLCIRQAIPQLLEYAYWGGDSKKVDKLIIVSENELDEESQSYLELLREKFGINLFYEQHSP